MTSKVFYISVNPINYQKFTNLFPLQWTPEVAGKTEWQISTDEIQFGYKKVLHENKLLQIEFDEELLYEWGTWIYIKLDLDFQDIEAYCHVKLLCWDRGIIFWKYSCFGMTLDVDLWSTLYDTR